MENQVLQRITTSLLHISAILSSTIIIFSFAMSDAADVTGLAKGKKVMPVEVKALIKQDVKTGAGPAAKKGDRVRVNYTGWLYDPSKPMGKGQQFDSSVGADPFEFKLGEGLVIKGWEEGFNEMRVGGKRQLIIPATMGYGERGAGNIIPPNANLMFEVELLAVNGVSEQKKKVK